MEYRCQKLYKDEVLSLLMRAENSFTPPLSQNISYTLQEYAERLSSNAMFVLCVNNEEVIGFSAYYINNEEKFAYIPQIWVSDEYQRMGIGSSMVNEIINTLPNTFRSIRLEVRKNNEKAYSFYIKSGYKTIVEKEGKLLMEKLIK